MTMVRGGGYGFSDKNLLLGATVGSFYKLRDHRVAGDLPLTENREEMRYNPYLIWDVEFLPDAVVLGDKLFIFYLILP
jgi:hypothetical protein